MNADSIFKRYADEIFSGSSFKKNVILEKSDNLTTDEFPRKEQLRKLIHKEIKYPETIGTHPDFAYLDAEECGKEYHYAVSVFLDIKGSTVMGTKLSLEDVRVIKNNIITNAIEFFQVFDGHIHRIQGDAVFAIFGRRNMKKADAVIDALNASTILQYHFDKFVSKSFAEMNFPPVKIRIGIDFGNDDKVLWSKYGIQNCSEITTTSIHTDLASKLQSNAPSNGIMIGNNIVDYLDLPEEFYCVKQIQKDGEKVEDKYVIDNQYLTYRMWNFEWKKYIPKIYFLNNIEGFRSNPFINVQCFYACDDEVEKEYVSNCGSLCKGVNLRFKLNILAGQKWDEIIWKVNNRGREAVQEQTTDFEMNDYKNKQMCLQSTAYKGHHYMTATVKYQNRILGQEQFGLYVCD